VHLADRVIVLYQGRIVTELAGQDLTEEAIASAALGAQPERVLA
jgi:ABC-type sugar transport system ATPase subunit